MCHKKCVLQFVRLFPSLVVREVQSNQTLQVGRGDLLVLVYPLHPKINVTVIKLIKQGYNRYTSRCLRYSYRKSLLFRICAVFMENWQKKYILCVTLAL